MNYPEMQAVVAATDAQYAAAQAAGDVAGMQAAVATRNAAVDAYNAYLATYVPPSSGGGGGGGGSYTPTAAPPPEPLLPKFTPLASTEYQIKQAPIDTIVFDNDAVSIQLMEELLYENIGGIELANMSRSDLIDGQDVSYSPIANLSEVNHAFNPNNIISSVSPQSSYFSRFQIDLLSRGIHIPEFDADGNIVIWVDDIFPGEVIEVQLASGGTIDRVDA